MFWISVLNTVSILQRYGADQFIKFRLLVHIVNDFTFNDDGGDGDRFGVEALRFDTGCFNIVFTGKQTFFMLYGAFVI